VFVLSRALDLKPQLDYIEIIASDDFKAENNYVQYFSKFNYSPTQQFDHSAGEVQISAANYHLGFKFQQSDSLQLYSFCGYGSYASPTDPKKCIPCPDGTYSLNLDSQMCSSCKDMMDDSSIQYKLDYICEINRTNINLGMIIGVSAAGLVLIGSSILFFLAYKRRRWCFRSRAYSEREGGEDLEEKVNKQLEKKLFEQCENGHGQTECCICYEEFKGNDVVREVGECKHIFHG